MATNRNRVLDLYTPVYDEFMFDAYAEKKQVHQEVFEEVTDSTLTRTFNSMSGLGEWEDSEEFDDGGFEDPTLGYEKTLTQEKKIKRFKVSFEAVDMDEYAILEKTHLAKNMGRGANAKVEREAAEVFNAGFSTAGPDGQFLFDSDHPKNPLETGTTYDNLLAGAFSHDNLEQAETDISNNMIGEDGIPLHVDDDAILLHPPALRGAVERVLAERASGRPGTANNDINRFAGSGYKPVEWWWLGSGGGRSGSNTAWYIVYPKHGFLKIVWSQKPHFHSWVDYGIEAYCFSGRMLYDLGAINWRFGFGSTGQ